MVFGDEFTPEERKEADTIGDRVSAAKESFADIKDPNVQEQILQRLDEDPPDPSGLDGDALRQVNEEISIRKAKADFLDNFGIKYDPTQPYENIFRDPKTLEPNVDNCNNALKLVKKAQDLVKAGKDKIFGKKAEADPKNSGKYTSWAEAISKIALAATAIVPALLAFLKDKNNWDQLWKILSGIADGMSGCFQVDLVKHTNHHLSCDESNPDSLRAACTNATYTQLSGMCTEAVGTSPPYNFVYRKYTVGDLLADMASAIVNIPDDVAEAGTWLWDHKWYILAVFVAILLALVGFGMARRYATT